MALLDSVPLDDDLETVYHKLGQEDWLKCDPVRATPD